MRKFSRVLAIFAAVLLTAAACGGGDSGSIQVENASFRLTPNDLGAGYVTITNTTSDAVTLAGASAEGIGRIELHETMQNDGIVNMEARPEGFTIEPGETIALEPGGKHMMLFEPSVDGDVMINLDFGSEIVPVLASFDELGSALASATDGADDHDHDGEGADHDGHDHDDEAADHDAEVVDHSEHDHADHLGDGEGADHDQDERSNTDS